MTVLVVEVVELIDSISNNSSSTTSNSSNNNNNSSTTSNSSSSSRLFNGFSIFFSKIFKKLSSLIFHRSPSNLLLAIPRSFTCQSSPRNSVEKSIRNDQNFVN